MTQILKSPPGSRGALRLPAPSLPSQSQASKKKASARDPLLPAAEPAAEVPPSPAVDIKALSEQAYREGLAQGRQVAEKELQTALEHQADQFKAGLSSMDRALRDEQRRLEQVAVVIAFEALAQVLGHAYADGAAVAAAVQQLIQRSPANAELTVVVPPHAMEALQRSFRTDAGGGLAHVQVKVDPTLARSACRVVNERGVLEADLEIQLQGILDALLQAHRGTAEGAPHAAVR